MNHGFSKRPDDRRGAILIIVLVLLLIASTIAVAILRAAVLDTRQFATNRHAMQADRLSEAGLARAAARLETDSNYQGESWTAELPESVGTVEIRVTTESGRRLVEAVATYPKDSYRRVRSRRTMPLE